MVAVERDEEALETSPREMVREREKERLQCQTDSASATQGDDTPEVDIPTLRISVTSGDHKFSASQVHVGTDQAPLSARI